MKNNKCNSGTKLKSKVFPVSIGVLWAPSYGCALHDWIAGFFMGFVMAMVFGLM